MRCDDLKLIQAWILEWRDCGVTFEIVPVVTSAEARAVVEPYLEPSPERPAARRLITSHFGCIHGPPLDGAAEFGRKSKPMSLSLYQSSVPVYERGLNAFLAILDKAEEHATARKFDPNNYLAMRLSPDMLPLVRQVQSFCDHAKNSSFRLAAKDPPVKEDKETTLAEAARAHPRDARHAEIDRRQGDGGRGDPRDRHSHGPPPTN